MWRVIVPTLEKVFVFTRARTQGNEESSRIQNSSRRVTNQVVSFLGDEPRDDRDDWPFRLFRKAEPSQQIKLALTLAAQVVGRKVSRNMRIGLRVPDLVIDAVRNSGEPITAPSRQPIQPVALFRSLNLMRVARAH